MTDFDARWRALARAAARGPQSHVALSEHQLAELASLARPRVLAFPKTSAHRRWETRALVASAALVTLILGVALRDPDAWRDFASDTAARVASLPDRTPSAPRLPSPSRALASVPDPVLADIWALLRSLSIDVETSR